MMNKNHKFLRLIVMDEILTKCIKNNNIKSSFCLL